MRVPQVQGFLTVAFIFARSCMSLERTYRRNLQVRGCFNTPTSRIRSHYHSHRSYRSYEKATDSSAKLFGRARVNFIAQNEALEIFLHPGAHAQEAFRRAISTKWLLSRLFRIFRLFTLFAILATALTTAIFLASHGIRTWTRSADLDVPTSSLFTASLSTFV